MLRGPGTGRKRHDHSWRHLPPNHVDSGRDQDVVQNHAPRPRRFACTRERFVGGLPFDVWAQDIWWPREVCRHQCDEPKHPR